MTICIECSCSHKDFDTLMLSFVMMKKMKIYLSLITTKTTESDPFSLSIWQIMHCVENYYERKIHNVGTKKRRMVVTTPAVDVIPLLLLLLLSRFRIMIEILTIRRRESPLVTSIYMIHNNFSRLFT